MVTRHWLWQYQNNERGLSNTIFLSWWLFCRAELAYLLDQSLPLIYYTPAQLSDNRYHCMFYFYYPIFWLCLLSLDHNNLISAACICYHTTLLSKFCCLRLFNPHDSPAFHFEIFFCCSWAIFGMVLSRSGSYNIPVFRSC